MQKKNGLCVCVGGGEKLNLCKCRKWRGGGIQRKERVVENAIEKITSFFLKFNNDQLSELTFAIELSQTGKNHYSTT